MIAQVALPLPIQKTFTYRVPSDLEAFMTPLVRVRVPFAKRLLTGLVVALGEEDEPEESLKPNDISDVIDLEPPYDMVSLNLCFWAARHYCTPLGLALKSSFPLAMDTERYLTVHGKGPDLLGVNGLRLKRACAVAGKEKIRQHYRTGLLEVRDVFTGEALKRPAEPDQGSQFSPTLLECPVEARREHYLSLVKPLLGSGLNVLMLLPDHGMAGGYFQRFFRDRLGEKMLLYGSQLSARQRGEVYFRVSRQGGYLVIGTRSCLFLPIHKAGLIIVERPEDEGYRKDQISRFNAVAVAGKKAELQRIPICYGSVSPPLELMKGVEEGMKVLGQGPERPALAVIRTRRVGMAEKPPPELTDLVAEGLACQEKTVIHTPLKDYGARLFCLSCRRPVVCPVCDSTLSFRKEDNRLICWRCGRQSMYRYRCRHCGSELMGFGSTGAEYVEEHLRTAMPEASVVRVTGDVVRREGMDRLARLVEEPRTIVVGTQVLSKFYDIKVDRLILIGWEDFLRITNYRAREHMYQTYSNLMDALRPSKVFLLNMDGATEQGEVLSVDRETFYRRELEARRVAEFPPYVRLFLLKVDGSGKRSAEGRAMRVREMIERYGLQEHVVGEVVQRGEKGRIKILVRGEGSLPDGLIDEIYRLRHIQVEADPTWV